MLNFVLQQAEGMSVGPPGFLGRIAVPQMSETVKRDITLNNITIDRSTIGILNTGLMQEIQQIDVNISKLEQTSQTEIAEALAGLTQAIASSGQISDKQRSELIQQLNELSDQALLAPNQRKTGVIRAIVQDCLQA